MNVQVSEEIIAGLAAAFVVAVTALLAFIAYLLRHIGAFSLALKSHADVNTALNAELLAVIRERKEERQVWEKERDDLCAQVEALRKAQVEAAESHDRQFALVNAQLAQERTKREALEKERLQWERDRAAWEVDRQTWGNDRQKWELALAESEANKKELATLLDRQRVTFEQRLTALQTSMDGKVNIPAEEVSQDPISETTEKPTEEKEGNA